MQDMVNHVMRTLGITVIHDYVHRLLEAPRMKTTASKRFKGLVNAKVTSKRNTKEKMSSITHALKVNIVYSMTLREILRKKDARIHLVVFQITPHLRSSDFEKHQNML